MLAFNIGTREFRKLSNFNKVPHIIQLAKSALAVIVPLYLHRILKKIRDEVNYEGVRLWVSALAIFFEKMILQYNSCSNF